MAAFSIGSHVRTLPCNVGDSNCPITLINMAGERQCWCRCSPDHLTFLVLEVFESFQLFTHFPAALKGPGD